MKSSVQLQNEYSEIERKKTELICREDELKAICRAVDHLGKNAAGCNRMMGGCCRNLETAFCRAGSAASVSARIHAARQKDPSSDSYLNGVRGMLEQELSRLEKERIGMVIALAEKEKEISAARIRELETALAGLIPGQGNAG